MTHLVLEKHTLKIIVTNAQAWEGFKSNSYNTYNINDGRVDYCDARGENHG